MIALLLMVLSQANAGDGCSPEALQQELIRRRQPDMRPVLVDVESRCGTIRPWDIVHWSDRLWSGGVDCHVATQQGNTQGIAYCQQVTLAQLSMIELAMERWDDHTEGSHYPGQAERQRDAPWMKLYLPSSGDCEGIGSKTGRACEAYRDTLNAWDRGACEQTSDNAREAIALAGVWSDAERRSRITTLLVAASECWSLEWARQEGAENPNALQTRTRAATAAFERLEHTGTEDVRGMTLCMSAAGTRDACEAFAGD